MGLTFPPSGGIDSAQTGSTQLGSTSSIMKFFLLAAALLGLSGALQPGFEYKYMYRGRVALGIPSISSQISTSAFYADAKVQVVDATELRIQFSNIFIGDMNSRVTCEDKLTQADGYTQIEYAPLEQYKDQLETPFAVKLTDDQVKPYQFPDNDDVWIRNIRRAFVHVLHIPTNAPNIGQSSISHSPSFNRMESHPLGECPTMYTVTPMKEHLLQFYKPDPLETDAQGDIEDTYWRLSKSVDFDNCVDMVSSHTFGTMLPGKYDNDKCGEEYLSTATTGFYTLKGGPRGVRIEKAVQEGTYVIDHDNVHFYSNQTLDLRSVDPVAAPFDVSGSFYSFRHEMDAFSWQSEKSSGSNIDKESVIGEIKSYAKQRFQKGADALKTGQPFEFAEDMEALSSSAGLLSKDDLQEIYDSLDGNARSLFMKAHTASGLEIPYMFLMEKLPDDLANDQTNANHIDIILNMVQNTKTPKLIEPMMNRVMNYKGPDFQRAMLTINLASLATRMCLKPCGREYLADAACQIDDCKKLVEDNYLPWLETGLNDESKTLWERLVYMYAIYNFNSEKILPILRPYVTGAKDVDVRLRVSAIYALRKDDMPSSTKNEILQALMAVFDNYQEHYRVRESAFGVMLFWKPEASWWHYMALNTWRDPNNYIVSLISNAIKTYKEYRPAARRVAALAKPINPKSLSQTFLAYNKDGNNDDMMRYWYEFFVSGNDEGIFPRMVSAYLRLGLLGTNFDPLKIVGHFDNSDMLQFFWKTFANVFGKKDWQPDAYLENVKAMYNEVLSKLEMQTKEPKKNLETFIHMTIFNNFQAIIPLMRDIGDFKFNPEMLMGLLGSIDINRQFFINSGRISHAYATEVGVPFMTRYTQPKFFSFIGKSSVSQSGAKSSVNFDMTLRFDRVIESNSRALIPWMGKSMVSGVTKRQLLVLPFNFQITYNSETTEFTFEFNPNDKSTKEHVGIYSEPFTVRAPIVTPKRLCALDDFKSIRKAPEVFKDDLIFPGTGFNLGAVYVGDVQPLFSRGSSNNFYASFFQGTDYQPFPPTNKYYKYKIGADYSKSQANGVTFIARYVTKNDAAKDYTAIAGANNYEVSGLRFKFIFRKDGGDEIRNFAYEFTWANGWTPRYESKMHLQLQKSEYEAEPASTRCLFVHTSSPRQPSMINTRDFLDIDHATKVIAQTYYGVNDCASSEPLMQFDGELTLSDEKKERLGYEEPTDCKKDLRNPNNFNILSYDKMTFTMKWQPDQQAKFPLSSYLVTYFLPGIMFPKVYQWYEENDSPANTATFEAYKKGEGWDMKFQKPYMSAVAERIDIPPFIEAFMLTPRPYEVTMYDRYFLGYDRPICYATASKVTTFDGLTFDHSLGNCWTVAVRDCKQDSGLINVRNNGGFEASILWTVVGLKVDITKDQVKINREVVEPGTATDLYQVHPVTQGMLVQISWVAAVRVTNLGISIEVHPSYKGSLCGACSNYDGDAATLTGPMGCSYSDYDKFMVAWAIPGDGCDDATLAAKKEQVKAYQASCNKQFVYPTGQVLTSMKESCFEYKYDVKTEGDYTCTSTEPISTCKAGCTTAIPYNSNVMYDCVPSDAAANTKQAVRKLPSFPTPGCHYFRKWWKKNSEGCEGRSFQ